MSAVLRNIALWCASMTWHLYHIALGKPQYKRLSDSPVTVGSFAFIMLFAALSRWFILDAPEGGASAFVPILASLVIYMMLLSIVSTAPGRSKTLFAALLGVSALFDIVLSALFILGVRETVGLQFGWLYEMLAMGWTAWRFFQEPPEVQAAGYRRRAAQANA